MTASIEMPRENDAADWPQSVRWILGLMVPVLLILILLDRRAEPWTERAEWLVVGLAAAFDWSDARRRAACFAGVFAAPVLIGVVAAAISGKLALALGPMFRYQTLVLWAAVCWLYSWWLVPCDNRGRIVAVVGMPLILLCGWAIVSGFVSTDRKNSFKLLGSELLPYAAVFLLLPRLLTEKLAGVAAQSCWAIVSLLAIAAPVLLFAHAYGGAPAEWMHRAEFFRIDEDARDTLRFQYIFQHHNRAGFFFACALFVCLTGAYNAPLWKRVAAYTGAVGCLIALPVTTTRGALAAAWVGLAIVALGQLLSRNALRVVVSLVLMVPLLWLVTPPKYFAHLNRIFSSQQYRTPEGGSINARFVIWDTTLRMIAKRPVLGFGYGFENFEETARKDHPLQIEYFRGAVHAHNQWLETAAETGIPGALLLLAFTAGRVGLLSWSWWNARRSGQAALAGVLLVWIALEVTIQFYSLTNYALRRGLGLFVYAIWSGSVWWSQQKIKAEG